MTLTIRAYRFALDPTPRQTRLLRAHADGARAAYNWGLSQIAVALDANQSNPRQPGARAKVPDHFALCSMWTARKNRAALCTQCQSVLIQEPDGSWRPEYTDDPCGDGQRHSPAPRRCTRCGIAGTQEPDGTWRPDQDRSCLSGKTHKPCPGLAWVADAFAGTHQAALRDAHRAWTAFFASRSGDRGGAVLGRPRFKTKRTGRPAFQTHGGALRMISPTRINLPKIGAVTIMSDDSRHPAMRCSRTHFTLGERHMGNRRRSRQVWQLLRRSDRAAAETAGLLRAARAASGLDPSAAVSHLNHIADERARADALHRLTMAGEALASAAPTTRTQLTRQVARARAALARARTSMASRTDRWTITKLDHVVSTGQLTIQQAEDLIHVHGLEDEAVTEEPRQGAADPVLEVAGRRPTADRLRRLAQQQARIVRASISLGADGLWWLSLTCTVPLQARTRPTRRQRTNGTAGLALGGRDIGRVSGRPDRIRNPRNLRAAMDMLRQAERQLSRTSPGSTRRSKARQRMNLASADVARLRASTLHRATTRLTRRYATLVIEAGGAQQEGVRADTGRRSRRASRDHNQVVAGTNSGAVGWQLTYKSARTATQLAVAEKGDPISRACSACGRATTKPTIPDAETFACPCGFTTPRTVNTARQLAKLAPQSGSSHDGSAQPRGEDIRPDAAHRGGSPQ